MAFDPAGLSALSYANGFTLWHYRTADTAADVDDIGYFNEASKMLRIGDFIFGNTGVGATPTHGVFVVLFNEDGVVDVSNATPFGSVNID